jgi:hypothetical protein
MNGLMEGKRLKITVHMVLWICLLCFGIHGSSLTPAWGDRRNQEFQGVIMEKDVLERVIYVNEMKVCVPRGTEITTERDVKLSLASLRPKQWVFIRAHLDGDRLIADRIVLIPRYIRANERKKYPFMATGKAK